MITVIDVCRKLDIEPVPDLTWAVGTAVRKAWESTTGAAPLKALRPKTNAGGSHCFALYPPEFESVIVRELRRHETLRAAQGSLF